MVIRTLFDYDTAVDSSINLQILQKELSFKVPFREENLVGNVIFGTKLNHVKVS